MLKLFFKFSGLPCSCVRAPSVHRSGFVFILLSQPWRDYIWMVLHSLRSLPSVQTHVLFRGVKLSAADLGAEYRTGECFLWSGFTSTTTTIESTQKFLGFVFLAWVLIRGDRSPRRSCAKPPACQCHPHANAKGACPSGSHPPDHHTHPCANFGVLRCCGPLHVYRSATAHSLSST